MEQCFCECNGNSETNASEEAPLTEKERTGVYVGSFIDFLRKKEYLLNGIFFHSEG